MKMYHNAYFHKTTRGVQHLVKDMLLELLQKHSDKSEITNLRLLRFFRDGGQLSDYEALDDNSILTVARIAAENSWGQASALANRFLRRQPYKCFELPPTQTGNVGRRQLDRYRAALREKTIYFIDDILSHRCYKQHAVTDSSLISRHRRASRENQPVRLLQHVVIFRLLSRKNADRHKERTEHQAYQHDFPVRAFVSAMKRRGHP
jgi:HD superfamily phosphohydrolase